MKQKDEANRAALLTPAGAGAIAVVRLNGRLVLQFLSRHFSKPCKLLQCIHGNLIDGERIIDDPVIVLSNNGETADINLHGGEWVVRECLEMASRNGFEILESAAELLDAETTIEREMLAALPHARTEQAIRMLLDQPRLWTHLLNELHAINKPALQGRVRTLLNDHSLLWMLHPPRVAIIGAPNVGKSTLANRLFGQTRSITADIPGTTRDWVADFANLDGLPIHLLDTPGQRDSSDSIEQAAIARSQREIEQADLKILVLDPTQQLEGEQRDVLNRYPNAMIVMNKSDLSPSPGTPGGGGGEGSADLRFLICDLRLNSDPIHIAALTGAGIDDLRRHIRQHFGISSTDSVARIWTQRQRDILTRALDDPETLKELD